MRLPVFLVFHLISFSLFAQNSKFKNQEFSFSIGISDLNIEKFTSNENLDFINYADSYNEYIDYIIVKFGYKFDFFSKMSADIKLILMDDLIPDNYDIFAHYFLKPWMGIGIGSMLNKNYITDFGKYQIQTLPDYYLMDTNVQQFTTYDLGFYLSPALNPVNIDAFDLLIKCDLGISFFLNEEAVFYHKRKLSNERLRYHYKTKPIFQPYIQPKLELRVRAVKIREAVAGILLNSGFYSSNRSINYTRTVHEWTWENSTNKEIESPKHNYSRFELEMGIYLRW